MKKLSIFLIALFFVLAFPGLILAKNPNPKVNTVVVPQGNQIENQNRVQTQNQGEDQENDEEKDGLKKISPRSQAARQHMSIVAQKVEELLTTQGAEEGIGEQVREFAKAQKQVLEETEKQLGKLESKPGLVKKLFGPNYKAIKALEKFMERNQLRIRELRQLQMQIANQDEQTQIEETIRALIAQNTALQAQVQTEEQTVSLFGWLVKRFVK